MTDQAIEPATEATTFTDVERRIKAILIGSAGNLVEWYDFYAYTAFALYSRRRSSRQETRSSSS